MSRYDPRPQHPHPSPDKAPKGREGDEVISTRGANPDAPEVAKPASKDRGRDRNPGDERRDEKGKVDAAKDQQPPASPPKGD